MPILKGNKKNLSLKRKLRFQMTPAENKLWLQLKNRQFENLKFRRQHGIGRYIVDFYCPDRGLVIEIDGDVHVSPDAKARDKKREEELVNLGLNVIRYFNDDVLNNMEGVLDDMYKRLFHSSTPCSPPYKGGQALSLSTIRGYVY